MASDLTINDGMVRVHQSAAAQQTFASTGLTNVHLDTVDWDPDSCFNPNPSSSPPNSGYAYTAPTDGYYLLLGRIGVVCLNSGFGASGAGDSFQARIMSGQNVSGTWVQSDLVLGSVASITSENVSNNTMRLASVASDLRFLSQGDQVQLVADIILNIYQIQTLTGPEKTYLGVMRLL